MHTQADSGDAKVNDRKAGRDRTNAVESVSAWRHHILRILTGWVEQGPPAAPQSG